MSKRKIAKRKRFVYHVAFIAAIILSSLSTKIIYRSDIAAQNIDTTTYQELQQPQPYTGSLPILIYHYVEYVRDPGDTIRISLNIQPHILDAQIKTLETNGYTFITPKDIPGLERGFVSVENPIILSFDDGYRDFYTDVFPILKKYQAKAIVYPVTGFLDKPNNMDWWQIEEIYQSGLVEIGAHSISHPSLGAMSKESARREIEISKSEIEKHLEIPVYSFAYPNGSFNQETTDLVKNAGYTSAVTTIEGTNTDLKDKYLLKRIHPGARIGPDLITHVENLT